MICSKRTQAAYQYKSVTPETEWTRARKALDYLDLDDRNSTLFDWYKKDFQQSISDEEDFKIPWIRMSGKGFPVDDCRVLRDWFNSDTRSMFFHLCIMKDREPDWIGRNVFLVFLIKKLASDDVYLESGENAVKFLNLATLCGFNRWKDSLIDDDRCISDCVFQRIYPSIVKGLVKVDPSMARRLLDMFYMNPKNLFMLFEKIPDDQHLQFFLNAAIGSGFDIWAVANCMDGFSYLQVIIAYVTQERYDLVMTLLRFGLVLNEEPIDWLRSIFMGLWGSSGDFTVTPEFKEMIQLLFNVHGYQPQPGMIQDDLNNVYRYWRATGDMDVERGREILDKLILAYETCGLDGVS